MKKSYGRKDQGPKAGESTIRVTKNGKFALSSTAVSRIGLDKTRQRVCINHPAKHEWFLVFVTPGSDRYDDALELISYQRAGLNFYLKQAALDFLEELEVDTNGITCQMAIRPWVPDEKLANPLEKAYFIITAPRVAELKEKNIRRAPNVRIPIATRMATIVQDEA